MSSLALAIAGGATAGVLHVFSGPDHLAAVVPFAVRSRTAALRVGMTWGLGHGLGVLLLGAVALALRSTVQIEAFSEWAEVCVGVMLVVLGAWALRSTRALVIHDHSHAHDHPHPHVHSHPHLHLPGHEHRHDAPLLAAIVPARRSHHHGVLGFGLLHGLAGAGHLLGVIPSLAMDRAGAMGYLGAFLLGGLAAMAGFALLIGRLVRREAWVPRALTAAGVASMAIGLFWVATALDLGGGH